MKKCKYCGRLNHDEVTYCLECGQQDFRPYTEKEKNEDDLRAWKASQEQKQATTKDKRGVDVGAVKVALYLIGGVLAAILVFTVILPMRYLDPGTKNTLLMVVGFGVCIFAEGGAALVRAFSQPAEPLPEVARYYIADGDGAEFQGPLTVDEVKTKLGAGQLSPNGWAVLAQGQSHEQLKRTPECERIMIQKLTITAHDHSA